jgi:surfeit locus 1 family protein
MNVSRTTVFFCVFAVAASLGCMRLGFWQLGRLSERRTTNAQITARLGEAAVPLERLPPNSAVRFRRATVTGRYDYENEFVLTSRSRNGAPGVHIMTPLRVGSGDTAVLVNRGWAYAPDGMRVDLALFRGEPNGNVEGFVDTYSDGVGQVSTPSVKRAVRRLDHDSIAAMVPYVLAPVVLVQRLDSGEATAVDRGTPVRVEPPPLDEGPHRSYAIQWFGFALVGMVGVVLVLQRERARRVTAGTKPG